MEKQEEREPSEQVEYRFTLICNSCGNKYKTTVRDSRPKDARTNAVTMAKLTAGCCSRPDYR